MSNNQKLLAACGLAALLFAVVAGITLSPGTLAPILPDESRLLFEVAGTGDSEGILSFKVPDNWQLRWDWDAKDKSATVLESVTWKDKAGKTDSIVAMHRKPIRPGSGVYIAKGGEYQIEVKGKGPWQIRGYRFDPLDKSSPAEL